MTLGDQLLKRALTDGETGLGLGDGTGVLQDVADLDELAEQLSQSYAGSRLDDLDLDKLTRQLGSDAAVDARTLQALEKALRESGTLRRSSDGHLALTPQAMRRLKMTAQGWTPRNDQWRRGGTRNRGN